MRARERKRGGGRERDREEGERDRERERGRSSLRNMFVVRKEEENEEQGPTFSNAFVVSMNWKIRFTNK